MNDPISDMLTRIRNANLRKHKTVDIPHSNLKENIVRVFFDEGFVHSYTVKGELIEKQIQVRLKYDFLRNPVIRSLRRESKLGRRVYRSVKNIGSVLNGQGVYVVSTSKGVFSDRQCRLENVSGEILCSVY